MPSLAAVMCVLGVITVVLAETRKKPLWRGYFYGVLTGVVLWTGTLVLVAAFAL